MRAACVLLFACVCRGPSSKEEPGWRWGWRQPGNRGALGLPGTHIQRGIPSRPGAAGACLAGRLPRLRNRRRLQLPGLPLACRRSSTTCCRGIPGSAQLPPHPVPSRPLQSAQPLPAQQWQRLARSHSCGLQLPCHSRQQRHRHWTCGRLRLVGWRHRPCPCRCQLSKGQLSLRQSSFPLLLVAGRCRQKQQLQVRLPTTVLPWGAPAMQACRSGASSSGTAGAVRGSVTRGRVSRSGAQPGPRACQD
jgi:hypothetical protein